MAGKFGLYNDKAGEFRFRLKAANGENILSGEGYTTKSACLTGIDSVRKNAPVDERYERNVNSAGKPYFNLKAGNHQIIGTSQAYSSDSSMENGIQSVKNNAPSAELVDLTT